MSVDLRYRGAKALWWKSATPEEKAEVDKLDKRIAALAKERKELSQRRYAITNRCTVRTLGRMEKIDG